MVFSKIKKMLLRGEKMKQEDLSHPVGTDVPMNPPSIVKKKRDIFRFKGEKDMAINLEHVTSMYAEGKRITFQFYSTATFVDLEDEVAAQKALEHILNVWSSYVVE
jgi:hypothetical protein